MSLDDKDRLYQFFHMALAQTKSGFKQQFIQRTKEAREAIGYSQDRIGQALGIKQDTYKNYEIDRELPHEYVPQFCAITGRSIEWLYTGKQRRNAA